MSEPGEWFVSVHGKQDGPLSWRVLIEKVRLGEVRRTDLVWNPGFESWTAAESVNGLFAPSPLPLVLGIPANTSKPVVHSDRPGELAAAVLEAQARAVRPAEKTPETLEELKPSRGCYGPAAS